MPVKWMRVKVVNQWRSQSRTHKMTGTHKIISMRTARTNNATVVSHQPHHGKTSRRSREISGSVEDPDESLPLEDDMMERMAKFMHSKGLVFALKEELAGQKGELGSRS